MNLWVAIFYLLLKLGSTLGYVEMESLGEFSYFKNKQNKQNFILLSTNKLTLYSLADGEAAWVSFKVNASLD